MVEFGGVTKNIFPLYKGTGKTKFEIAFWSVVSFWADASEKLEYFYEWKICGGWKGHWFRRNIIGALLFLPFAFPWITFMFVALVLEFVNKIFWLVYNFLFKHRAGELWLEQQNLKEAMGE